MELPLPALREQDLVLVSSESTRGPASDSPVPPLAGRVTLGGPLAVPVTTDYVANDADLRAFVTQEATQRIYHIVHLSVSFSAKRGAPRLHSTTVELKLSAPGSGPQPLAWSALVN